MQFDNPIVGGTTLIRDAIQSQNFSAVSPFAGWQIKEDGTATFNGMTLREGITVSSTNLYYNGTPALGNLIASISPTAGTDAYGNDYLSGICAYNDSAPYNICQLQASGIEIGVPGLPGQINQRGGVIHDSTTGGTLLTASQTNTVLDPAYFQVLGGSNTAIVPNGTEPYAVLTDGSGISVASYRVSGAILKCDVSGNPYTLQTPVFGTGWATGAAGTSTYQAFQYRQLPTDSIKFQGIFHSTSATPSSTIFTLPAGYVPKMNQRYACVSNNGGVYSPRSLDIQTTGAVSIDPPLSTSGTDVYIPEINMPLGNLA